MVKKKGFRLKSVCDNFNYYVGGTVSLWVLSFMVVLTELSPGFKDLLVLLFTHHWIGKVVITTLAFLISGWLFKDLKKAFGYEIDKLAWNSAIINVLIIITFYVLHYFLL